MKKLIASFLLFSTIMGPVSFASQNEELKKTVVQTYNEIVSLEGQAYMDRLNQLADQAESVGLTENANVLREMADPELKPELVRLMKDRINGMSENGLALLIWAMMGGFSSPGMTAKAMLPVVIILGILTLDGDEASRY